MTRSLIRTSFLAAALVASASILGACVTDSRTQVSSAMPDHMTPGAQTIIDTMVDSRNGLANLCLFGPEKVQQAVVDVTDGLVTEGAEVMPATDAPLAGQYLRYRCLALRQDTPVTAAK